MIYLITGKPGTGKTLTSVKLGYEFIRQGRDVYYNFDVDYSPLDEKQGWLSKSWHRLLVALDFQKPRSDWGKVYRWGRSRQAGLKEFPSINKGVIIMDEGHIWVNSREYTELSPEFHYKVAQHRKDGLDIYIISQHEARIDKVIRELVNDVINLHKFPDGPRSGLFFWWNIYDIGQLDKEDKKSHGFKLFLPPRKFYKCYDTFFKFEGSEHLEFELMYDPVAHGINSKLQELKLRQLKGGDSNASSSHSNK